MIELSLHILDIIQNSIVAGAKNIHLSIIEDLTDDLLLIEIKDDGTGMDNNEIQKALDPYFTSRTTRKVGLGLPLFKMAAEQCKGSLSIKSGIGKGTTVTASFSHSNIDRQPMGDISGVLCILIGSNPETDFTYEHKTNIGKYKFETGEIRKVLEGMPLNDPKVIKFLKEMIFENIKEIKILP